MREVSISNLASGDVLAKPILSRNGVVLLDAGTVLTDVYIRRLKVLDIQSVTLRQATGELWQARAESSRAAFDLSEGDWTLPDIGRMKEDANARETAVQSAIDFASTLHGLEKLSLPIPKDRFQRQFQEKIAAIVANREFADELSVMLQTDTLLFQQAMQVALFAEAVGTARGYDEEKLYQLALGSVFSDVGMTRLPSDLTKVTRELTEVERKKVRSHTIEGYKILSRMKDVPLESAKVALQHHERYRGEGYPNGLTHREISEFAQIVGIADVFNALVSTRHHRKAFAAEEAIEYLFAAGNYDFDLSLIQTYLRYLTVYPPGSVVLLTSGQTAYVVETANRPVLRPVVQIFREPDGSAVASPYLIDLEQRPHLAILRRVRETI